MNRPGTDLLAELDVPVERDDAYYDEVRQAVRPRCSQRVLVGTSTKSLERNLEKLKKLQRGEDPQPQAQPQRKSPPESESASRTAIRIWEAVKFVIWVMTGLLILLLIRAPMNGLTEAAFVVMAIFWCFLSVVVYIRRHAAEKRVDEYLSSIRSQSRERRERREEGSREKAGVEEAGFEEALITDSGDLENIRVALIRISCHVQEFRAQSTDRRSRTSSRPSPSPWPSSLTR